MMSPASPQEDYCWGLHRAAAPKQLPYWLSLLLLLLLISLPVSTILWDPGSFEDDPCSKDSRV